MTQPRLNPRWIRTNWLAKHRHHADHAFVNGDDDSAEWHLSQEAHLRRIRDLPQPRLYEAVPPDIAATKYLRGMLIAEHLGYAKWNTRERDWDATRRTP